MTREEILAMEPGRELDALVAEKVIGLRVIGTYFMDDGLVEGWCDPDTPPRDLPFYSTRIEAAWQVVEHLRDCLHLREHGGDGRWEAYFCGLNEPDEYGHGDAAPEAICKAALLIAGESAMFIGR